MIIKYIFFLNPSVKQNSKIFMFENGQNSNSNTCLTFNFFLLYMYIFFNSTWFLQWHKRLREADLKDSLLHVAQSDGSKKNTYLIIINPAYTLKNTTLHIISYSSWYVFYTRTNCILFKQIYMYSKKNVKQVLLFEFCPFSNRNSFEFCFSVGGSYND
jgi:hypothetical protein